MKHSCELTLALLLLVSGCGRQNTTDKVTLVADNDPRMNAAIEKARGTTNTFITALRIPKSNQTGFAIKVPFTDGDQTEHMWLSSVSYDGKNFQATVDNEPENVKTVKLGQKLTVEPTKISDW